MQDDKATPQTTERWFSKDPLNCSLCWWRSGISLCNGHTDEDDATTPAGQAKIEAAEEAMRRGE